VSSEQFHPAKHRFMETIYFDDLEIGEQYYINSRTMMDAQFSAFQAASGDNHPIYYDLEYCRALGSSGITGSRLSGAHTKCRRGRRIPPFIGRGHDRFYRTIQPIFETGLYRRHPISDVGHFGIEASVQHRRCRRRFDHSQSSRELVLEGEQRYLVRRSDPKG
jgi:hypothetical protein